MIELFKKSNFKLKQEGGKLDLYDLYNLTKKELAVELYEIEKKINLLCLDYIVTLFVYTAGHGAMRYKAPILFREKAK